MDDDVHPGDPRYPSVGGTVFVILFVALATALVSLLLDWAIWPWIVGAVIVVYLIATNVVIVRRHRRLARFQQFLSDGEED
jgi:hypothetical protein